MRVKMKMDLSTAERRRMRRRDKALMMCRAPTTPATPKRSKIEHQQQPFYKQWKTNTTPTELGKTNTETAY